MQQRNIPPGFSLFQDSLDYVANAAEGDFKALRNSHIFLTGCTAFFGKWLVECLLWGNDLWNLDLKLTVLTRHADKYWLNMPHLRRYKSLTVVEGTLETYTLEKLSPFQFAIHAVNLPYTGTKEWPAQHMRTAVFGTNRLMEAARAKNCKTVMYISSGGTYGTQYPLNPPFRESAMPVALNEPAVYGNTKRFIEFFIRGLGQEMGITVPIARLFTFAGAYTPLEERGALGSFILHALRNEPIIIIGDGTTLRSYLNAADMVIWTLGILVRGGDDVYNIGSAQSVSVRELAFAVLRCSGRPESDIKILNKPIQGNAPAAYIPDIARSTRLGLKESYTLEVMLREMLDWYMVRRSFWI